MKPGAKKALRVVAGTVLLAAVATVLVKNLPDVSAAVRDGRLRVRWLPLAGSAALLVLHLGVRAFLGHRVTTCLGVGVPLFRAIPYWMMSWVGRYVPGKVFMAVGRAYLHGLHGADRARVVLCVVLETIVAVAAALLVSVSVLLVAAPQLELPGGLGPGAVLLALVLTALVLQPRVIGWCVARLSAWTGRKTEAAKVRLRHRDIVEFFALAVLHWCILGGAFWLFVQAVADAPPSSHAIVAAAFPLAAIVGFLALIAPGGLGVREGVLMAILGTQLPIGIASLIALAARVWVVVVEVSCALAARAIVSRHPIDVTHDSA